MNSHDYEEVKTMTNNATPQVELIEVLNLPQAIKAEDVEIFDYDLEADVMEYLDLVDTNEYIDDWCKEILPDSDEY